MQSAVSKISNATFDVPIMPEATAVLKRLPATDSHPGVEYRLAGDRYVLVEYGPMELDLNLRVRVHMLEKWLADDQVCNGLDDMVVFVVAQHVRGSLLPAIGLQSF